MICGQAGGQRDTQGPISGLIPTGRESDHGSPMFQVDVHVIRLQNKKEQESFLCESGCLPLVTTLQNQDSALSKIFLIITRIAYDLIA